MLERDGWEAKCALASSCPDHLLRCIQAAASRAKSVAVWFAFAATLSLGTGTGVAIVGQVEMSLSTLRGEDDHTNHTA